ncbi:MAG: hypothetical protein K2X27_17850 [Candidatus Obscuribacterales bacterium]|nr:hypothetical protein [Candidatus Obscuribacterales bacterium]
MDTFLSTSDDHTMLALLMFGPFAALCLLSLFADIFSLGARLAQAVSHPSLKTKFTESRKHRYGSLSQR